MPRKKRREKDRQARLPVIVVSAPAAGNTTTTATATAVASVTDEGLPVTSNPLTPESGAGPTAAAPPPPPTTEAPLQDQFEANRGLWEMIPEMYAIVISYGLYVIADTILKMTMFTVRPTAAGVPVREALSNFDGLLRILVMVAFLIFVIDDIGDLLKINRLCPYRRPARYKLEVLIGLSYFFSFVFASRGSYLSVIFFGLAICVGGAWCNQWKHEYSDCDDARRLAATLRDVQYVGGAAFMVEAATFIMRDGELARGFTRSRVDCFLATYVVVLIGYEVVLRRFHRAEATKYLVSSLRRF